MNIRRHKSTQSDPPQRRAGLTILEMLVSTAMLSFIVLGLTAVLIQTQKAFKTGIKQNTITDAGRSIVDMISGDMRQMSDGQNANLMWINTILMSTNPTYTVTPNFSWSAATNAPVTNYENGVAIRTNELNDIFILEHTNTAWVAVGYAVSNYPGIGVGALYRYETNWTSLAPVFTNDLYTAFHISLNSQTFPNTYWHRVADGVIDLRIRAFDQFGNENDTNYFNQYRWFGYPIVYPLAFSPLFPSNTLPNSVELEFGILEPDTLIQARGLTGNPTALYNFLSSNAAPKMEVFRQRITIAAATR